MGFQMKLYLNRLMQVYKPWRQNGYYGTKK
jgi:hypothetical protein